MMHCLFRLFTAFENISGFPSSLTRVRSEESRRFNDMWVPITYASPVQGIHRMPIHPPNNYWGTLFFYKNW